VRTMARDRKNRRFDRDDALSARAVLIEQGVATNSTRVKEAEDVLKAFHNDPDENGDMHLDASIALEAELEA